MLDAHLVWTGQDHDDGQYVDKWLMEGRQSHLKKITINNINISTSRMKTVQEIGVLKCVTCALQPAK